MFFFPFLVELKTCLLKDSTVITSLIYLVEEKIVVILEINLSEVSDKKPWQQLSTFHTAHVGIARQQVVFSIFGREKKLIIVTFATCNS